MLDARSIRPAFRSRDLISRPIFLPEYVRTRREAEPPPGRDGAGPEKRSAAPAGLKEARVAEGNIKHSWSADSGIQRL